MTDEARNAETRKVDHILDAGYLTDLEHRPLQELRSMHDECLAVETEASFVRRLAQARIDILEAELDRRAAGGSLGDLVAALPRILADSGPRSSPATSRLPRHLGVASSGGFTRGFEHLVDDATLAKLPNVPEEDLRATLEQLRTLEREVSATRRALHGVIDRVESAIAVEVAAVELQDGSS